MNRCESLRESIKVHRLSYSIQQKDAVVAWRKREPTIRAHNGRSTGTHAVASVYRE